MAKKMIGQRAEYRMDGKPAILDRTFMDTHRYSERAWREGLAVAVLGDYRKWQRIELIGVQPIMSED